MNNQPSTKQDRGKVYLAVIVLANVLLLLLFAFANYSDHLQVNKEDYSIYGCRQIYHSSTICGSIGALY